jgi:hypothetical protein
VGLIKALVGLHPDGIFFVSSGARHQHRLRALQVFFSFPRPTSTRPGQHSVVPDLHQHFWAGIFFPGLALGFPGLALEGPGRHIYVLADICGAGVDSGTPRPAYIFFWPIFSPAGRHKAIPSFLVQNMQFMGRLISNPALPRESSSGGPAPPSFRLAHPGLSAPAPAADLASAVGRQCWLPWLLLRSGWASAGLGRLRPSRPFLLFARPTRPMRPRLGHAEARRAGRPTFAWAASG